MLNFRGLLPQILLSVPLIVLDAGHEPSKGGATASCLKKEYQYNDEIVELLTKALQTYRVVLTRGKEKEVDADKPGLMSFVSKDAQKVWEERKTLLGRAAIANKERAELFISIHHDSVPEKELVSDPALCGGKGGLRINRKFTDSREIGFNIFVYDNAANPNKTQSIAFARIVGKHLKEMGRVASNYHIQPYEPCESCRVVDADLGVYNQDLAVLKNTNMPAILVEVGNLMHPRDEQEVSSPLFGKRFADAMLKSLKEYFAQATRFAPPRPESPSSSESRFSPEVQRSAPPSPTPRPS